jgi:hypothetical protein
VVYFLGPGILREQGFRVRGCYQLPFLESVEFLLYTRPSIYTPSLLHSIGLKALGGKAIGAIILCGGFAAHIDVFYRI